MEREKNPKAHPCPLQAPIITIPGEKNAFLLDIWERGFSKMQLSPFHDGRPWFCRCLCTGNPFSRGGAEARRKPIFTRRRGGAEVSSHAEARRLHLPRRRGENPLTRRREEAEVSSHAEARRRGGAKKRRFHLTQRREGAKARRRGERHGVAPSPSGGGLGRG
jgi:hypothetical protein